jgi:hypothetical protein
MSWLRKQFETLVLRNKPACPTCQSDKLEQLISLFSVDCENTRQTNINRTRQQNRKIQRDKAIAEQEAAQNAHD